MRPTADPLVITSEPTPSPEDVRAVQEGLLAFNVERLGPPNYAPVHLFLRDAGGTVVGGLIGQRRWRWLYIAQLWVHPHLRGGGAGSRLLAHAEREARAAGCTDVALDTFSFQARPFYERNGFSLFGTLEGYPPGHRQYFLHKRLTTGDAVPPSGG